MLLLSWFLPHFGLGNNPEIAELFLSAQLWWCLIKQKQKISQYLFGITPRESGGEEKIAEDDGAEDEGDLQDLAPSEFPAKLHY